MVDADAVARKVEERRRRAHELGVDQLICSLFYDKSLRSYDTSQPRHELTTYPMVEFAGSPKHDSNRLTIRGVNFVFEAKDSSFEGGDYERVGLHVNGVLVFEVMVHRESESWGTTHSPGLVTAFIEGPWVGILRELDREIANKWRAAARASERTRAEEDMRKFGVDPETVSETTLPRMLDEPSDAASTSLREGTDWGDWYAIGYMISWVIVFFATYIYCIATYGFLLGVGLGWVPSAIVATVVSAIWPLLIIGLVILLLVFLQ